MESLFKLEGRNTSTRLVANAGRRRPRKLPLRILTSIVLANVVQATTAATVNVSPMVAKSALMSPADSAKQINVILSLPLGDSAGAAQFVQRVSNPKDEVYRKYITPQEFARRFGANAGDYAGLKEWASANGLTIVHESLARTFLTVSGTVRQFQTLFKTELSNYRSPDGKEFYSAGISPTVPDILAAKAVRVIGLTNSVQYAPLAKVYKKFGEEEPASVIGTDTYGGTGPGGAYAASDLRTAYRIPEFCGAAPQTVGVFEQG